MRKGVPFSTPFSPLTFTSHTTLGMRNGDRGLVVTSAAARVATTSAARGMTSAAARRAVSTNPTVATAAAAIASVSSISAVGAWLRDGLAHVELWTRVTASTTLVAAGP